MIFSCKFSIKKIRIVISCPVIEYGLNMYFFFNAIKSIKCNINDVNIHACNDILSVQITKSLRFHHVSMGP